MKAMEQCQKDLKQSGLKQIRSLEDSTELQCSLRRARKIHFGVILFDETIRQKMDEGTPIPRYLTDRGMLPGIKVDTGAKPLAGHTGDRHRGIGWT